MISSEDYKIVEKQIGRSPRGIKEVLVRDRAGSPRVVRVSPLINGKPFGSMYWLSCPQLKKKIDHLEGQGLVLKIQKEVLEVDQQFFDNVYLDHQKYIKDRLKYLKEDGLWDSVAENIWPALKNRGIGCIQDFKTVRCLHMHYAQHLIYPTTIGKYLDDHFELHKI